MTGPMNQSYAGAKEKRAPNGVKGLSWFRLVGEIRMVLHQRAFFFGQREGFPESLSEETALCACIAQLAKLQIEVFTSERLKRIETAFIKAMASLPTETVAEYYKRYEALGVKDDQPHT